MLLHINKIILSFKQNLIIYMEFIINIVTLNNVTFQYLGNAFSLASFFLALQKLIFGFLPPFQNFCLLSIFAFFSFFNCYYLQFQYLYVLLLRKIMPKHFFAIRDSAIDVYLEEFAGYPEFQEEWINLKKVTLLEIFFHCIFIFLVWFNLFIQKNKIKFFFFYYVIFYCLVFNNFMGFIPIYFDNAFFFKF